ncbi:MAG: VCBS repeat-containing protein [Gammaproteobacteria bacterium]|nr:VCBS repeat-containing protein [Gammaproteobacteria bacterium]
MGKRFISRSTASGVRVLLLGLLAMFLSACGGSGGSGSSGNTGNNPPPEVNEPPTVSVAATGEVVEGGIPVISVTTSDPENDDLRVTVEQLEGPDANAHAGGIKGDISLSVPAYEYGNTLMVFRVTVSDPSGNEATTEFSREILPYFEEVTYSGELFRHYRSAYGTLGVQRLAVSTALAGRFRIGVFSDRFNPQFTVYSDPDLAPEAVLYDSSASRYYDSEIVVDLAVDETLYLVIDDPNSRGIESSMYRLSPYLEDGFPTAGEAEIVYRLDEPEFLPLLVGNIDGDATLEILSWQRDASSLMAWNHDGSDVSGWPEAQTTAAVSAALGNLSGSTDTLEVAASVALGSEPCGQGAFHTFDATAMPLAGWPVNTCETALGSAPMLVDTDSDQVDEIFFEGYGFEADGTPIAGWASAGPLHAAADIDADGKMDFIYIEGGQLHAKNLDGTSLPGFPLTPDHGATDTSPERIPVIGDVTGDGSLDIVVFNGINLNVSHFIVDVYANDGTRQYSFDTSYGSPDTPAPALADLDGDGDAEIVFRARDHVEVFNGDGSSLAGWPVYLGNVFLEYAPSTVPLVGDVDGDNLADIVVTTEREVIVLASDGTVSERIVLENIGRAGAIADIDADGRNEIVVYAPLFDTDRIPAESVWVFDLGGGPHGAVEWGQYGGGPRHRQVLE